MAKITAVKTGGFGRNQKNDMNLLTKIIGRDESKIFSELDAVRARVSEWQSEFSALSDHVSKFESDAAAARERYFEAPNTETLAALAEATNKAKLFRETFSANVGVNEARRTQITETQQVRGLLVKACRAVHRRLDDLAAQHLTDETARCQELGIKFGGSATADALGRKAERVADELSRLENDTRPCWAADGVLRSI